MVSAKQLEANRRNAQKSTGPRTEAGKERSRANAITHGLRTTILDVLPQENAEEFAARLETWLRNLDPRNPQEEQLARQAATISWKLDRADRYETAVLSRRVIDAVNACDCEDNDVQTLREAAAIASFDPSNEGERLRRYQFALMRELRQTIDAFTKLRKQPIAPNEPSSHPEPIATSEPTADPEPAAPSEAIPEAEALARHGSPDLAETDDRRSPSNDCGREAHLPIDAQATNESSSRNQPARRPSAEWLLERRRAMLSRKPEGSGTRRRNRQPAG